MKGPVKKHFELRVHPDAGDFCENGRRKMYRVWTPSLPGVWTPQVHGPCAHNLVSGLLQRTMGPTPLMTEYGQMIFSSARKELMAVLKGRSESVEPWPLQRVVESYTVRRLRVRYQAAHESLLRDGYCDRSDAKVKAFVKGEKLARYKISKPRVIMGRSPRYNLELASYLKPLEHQLYGALRGYGAMFFTRTRLVAKGLGLDARARLIQTKMTCEPDIVAMEIDGKSFESHFSKFVLDSEHKVYTGLCPHRRLAELLSWQLEFTGKGEGVRFKVSGVRASGDFNTGMGNTVVMCLLVLATARELGCRFDFLADGDNALLFVKKSDELRWRQAITYCCLEMGFEMVLGESAEHLAEVCFGQSKPFMGERLTMVRDVFKVLSHGACGYRHYHDMRGGMKVLKSVAYCEAVLNRGVPVLQEYAHALLRATRHVTFSAAEPEQYEYAGILARGVVWERASRAPITTAARIWFEKSWGLSVEAQLQMEEQLRRGFKAPTSWDVYDLETTLPDGRDLFSGDSLAPLPE